MLNAMTFNQSMFNFFTRSMHGKLTDKDTYTLALIATALVSLNINSILNDSDSVFKSIEIAEKEYPKGFGIFHSLRAKFDQNIEQEFINFVIKLSENQSKGLLNDKISWLYQLTEKMIYSAKGNAEIAFIPSVYELCNRLFSDVGEGNLYLPFDPGALNSVMLSQTQAVFIELSVIDEIPELIQIILDNFHYEIGDAVENPSYIRDGKLQQFSKGFISEPWGIRKNLSEQVTNRFTIRGNNYQNYLIQHLFQQVQDFAIITVPLGSLYSTVQSEENMRHWLITQKHLKSVLLMPQGVITTTGISSALLIFDLKNQYNDVHFINLVDSEFVTKKERNVILTQLDKLVTLINKRENSSIGLIVDHKTIAENDYVLDPTRYILNKEEIEAFEAIQHYPTKALYEIADIIRPNSISLLKEEGEESVFEVQSGDLPQSGYIDIASKETKLGKEVFSTVSNTFLQANDIIFTIRGTTGKVGIVSQDLIDKYQSRLLVGQTCVVLRLKNSNEMSAIALLMQLRSTYCQTRLQHISSGIGFVSLSMKDLKLFPIAMFTREKQQQIEQNFIEQEKIKQSILTLQAQQLQLANNFWA